MDKSGVTRGLKLCAAALPGTLLLPSAVLLYRASSSGALGALLAPGAEARRAQGFDWDAAHASNQQALDQHQTQQEAAFVLQGWHIVLGLLFDILITGLYFFVFIRPSANKYLKKDSPIPADLKGKWKLGIFDCFQDFPTCLCFCCCGPCTVADLWYRSGHLHAVLGSDMTEEDHKKETRGWPWLCGCCAASIFSAVGVECLPLGFLRGCLVNADDAGRSNNGIVPLRQRFGITGGSMVAQILEDCICWCCCGPCVGTQEYHQVMRALEHQEQQGQSSPPAMVGMPVETLSQPGQP